MSSGWIAFWSTVGGVLLAAIVGEAIRQWHKRGERRDKAQEAEEASNANYQKMRQEVIEAYVIALSAANDWLRKHPGDLTRDGIKTIGALELDTYRCWDAAKITLSMDGSALTVLDAARQQYDLAFRQIKQAGAVPNEVNLRAARDEVRALLERFR